jgi:DNA-binding NarL/FixJ family response regulator
MASQPIGKKPRIVLAEDHALVAEGIGKLLQNDYHLMKVVSDGRALLKTIKKDPPDLVLVDLSLPFLNGLDATRQITQLFPGMRVVILTMHDDPRLVEDAVAAGASGYILKESAASELLFALQEAIAGRTYFRSSGIHPKQETPLANTKNTQTQTAVTLTPRQREVLQLIAEGRTNKEIATILGLAIKTVEFHKTRLMRTLDIHSIPELTTFAMANRISVEK